MVVTFSADRRFCEWKHSTSVKSVDRASLQPSNYRLETLICNMSKSHFLELLCLQWFTNQLCSSYQMCPWYYSSGKLSPCLWSLTWSLNKILSCCRCCNLALPCKFQLVLTSKDVCSGRKTCHTIHHSHWLVQCDSTSALKFAICFDCIQDLFFFENVLVPLSREVRDQVSEQTEHTPVLLKDTSAGWKFVGIVSRCPPNHYATLLPNM